MTAGQVEVMNTKPWILVTKRGNDIQLISLHVSLLKIWIVCYVFFRHKPSENCHLCEVEVSDIDGRFLLHFPHAVFLTHTHTKNESILAPLPSDNFATYHTHLTVSSKSPEVSVNNNDIWLQSCRGIKEKTLFVLFCGYLTQTLSPPGMSWN